jgi:hypothetical protein
MCTGTYELSNLLRNSSENKGSTHMFSIPNTHIINMYIYIYVYIYTYVYACIGNIHHTSFPTPRMCLPSPMGRCLAVQGTVLVGVDLPGGHLSPSWQTFLWCGFKPTRDLIQNNRSNTFKVLRIWYPVSWLEQMKVKQSRKSGLGTSWK